MKTTIKKPTIYDFVLSLYTGNDELRPALETAGIKNGKAYATDAHAAIRFDEKLCGKASDYLKNDKFPDAEAVFNKLEFDSESTVLASDIMLGLLDCKLEVISVQSKCKDCKGEGAKEVCKCCNNTETCEDCNGDGFVDEYKPFAGITLCGEDVSFLGKRVKPYLLYKVAHTALLLGEKQLSVKYCKNRSELLFTFGAVEVLVMAVYQSTH